MQLELKLSWIAKTNPFLLLSIITSISAIDVLMVRILGLIGSQYSLIISLLVFLAFFTISEIFITVLLKKIASFESLLKYNSKGFGLLFRLLLVSPIAPIVIMAFILFQIFEGYSYHVVLIPIVTITSYGSAIIILTMLLVKFVRWYSINHDYMLLAYTIAIGAIVFNLAILILNLPAQLYDYTFVRHSMKIQDIIINEGIPTRYFVGTYTYSSFFSFTLIWVATSVLLRNYFKKIGKLVYWLLVAIPLIYFLAQYPQVFDYLFSSVKDYDPILYARLSSIIFGLSKTAGGVFFAIGFWVIARSIDNRKIRNYLLFSGHGILLLFVASQANSVIISPYPPFGLVAISSVILASLMTFVGLYFTALSISSDTRVRAQIDKKLTQLAFVKKMGTAQMEVDLYRQVLPILHKSSNEDNIPTSLEPDDLRQFVKEALEALKDPTSKSRK